MEYSAVDHPPLTPWAFIQRGTLLSIVAAQMTLVFPKEQSTDPSALGAKSGINVSSLSSLISAVRSFKYLNVIHRHKQAPEQSQCETIVMNYGERVPDPPICLPA